MTVMSLETLGLRQEAPGYSQAQLRPPLPFVQGGSDLAPLERYTVEYLVALPTRSRTAEVTERLVTAHLEDFVAEYRQEERRTLRGYHLRRQCARGGVPSDVTKRNEAHRRYTDREPTH
eukprot:CAMPEP_0119520218 /NCGR_PEP_ID=MMETSP1344-20130328/36282_1 /TAXON_ID=236787 /ORGANISM="Florenciella parvula, Strain CCMP2471" /LENGTH=118 /DNA_ID=CAMNT_0007558075 /DNA_START=384 /DNA_END=741 /DNA_ORIENTATION=-